MNYDTGTARDDAYEGRALVAAFPDRESAHQAAHSLHEEGFGRTWIGVTHPADSATYGGAGGAAGDAQTRVSSDDGDSLGSKIGRFFSGESGERTLYDELVRHGVAESAARRIDGSLASNSAILTVDGHNHPELAAQLLESSGGHILAGEAFGGTIGSTLDGDTTRGTLGAGATGAAGGALAGAQSGTTVGRTGAYDVHTDADAVRGSRLLGYGDAAQYARGTEIDEERRLQLRAERLNVDKQRVSAGEATIGKDIVETRQDIDVPTIREELFVERRPVSETTVADAGPITEGETIRIPLMRENVVVTKRTVVTGEVVVGKRQVTDTQHVSDTTREERLNVNEGKGTVRDGDVNDARDYADDTLVGGTTRGTTGGSI